MEDGKKTGSGPSRRKFIAAVGATAASAAFAQKRAEGVAAEAYYQDSFGDTVPASPAMLAIGAYPPPIEGAQAGAARVRGADGATTSKVPGYTSPNFLMIMVDQLRAPRWLPSGGQAAIDSLLPNIAAIRNQSMQFGNFFAASAACTPSRSTLLTGLYTQRTCMFQTQGEMSDAEICVPSLETGFPNIATVLSQTGLGGGWLPYTCAWIGKWHLSDPVSGLDAGPTAYGFQPPGICFPPSSTFPSPNGVGNEGTEGYNPTASPMHQAQFPGTSAPTADLYCDAAICDYFFSNWLPSAPSSPWFTAVSFVNPHDITGFPFTFNLLAAIPPSASSSLYPPPPTAGSPGGGGPLPDTFLPALPTLYNTTPPSNWNYPDAPVGYLGGLGKPDLQRTFQYIISQQDGSVDGGYTVGTVTWQQFFNYYFWMQKCVDGQISRLMTALSNGTIPGASNTIVIFLSDHGDYGGSHSLHSKGGALYDESINVPFYVSLPQMRQGQTTLNSSRFVCSMVDVLPFLYAMALGSDFFWRQNSGDTIAYLNGRESIMDAIYSSTPKQRRLSGIPFNNGATYNGQSQQPYILHATDEFTSAVLVGGSSTAVPSHAIAFRTVDLTVGYANADGNNVNGGGKYGIYSFWPAPNYSNPDPSQTQPLIPNPTNQQFEFYDYTGALNYGETGNNYMVMNQAGEYQENPLAMQYDTAFNSSAVQAELYQSLTGAVGNTYTAALVAYLKAQVAVRCSGQGPTPDA